MRFETKIAIAVRDDLAGWQKLNVTAFLASGIAHATDDIMGKPYEDGAGREYLSLFREPVLIFAADATRLATVHERALRRELATAVYTADMFTTDNDDDNRAAVRAADPDHLNLVGLAIYGPRNGVDRTVKGLTLHP
ncbi:DUF2000 domain-containing protein [Nocardia transvalensis]|uniref:DUF2000 domain-containing protein n=1 Tax=Nocardia transvalensis TaxID=37333 RepID=UPI0018937F76|nr:DUF2000 domain-containing protein [Nocardia transvalensis]MBF6332616.1 DUF2000 domain-containing protein [Nocardia transvalensis]